MTKRLTCLVCVACIVATLSGGQASAVTITSLDQSGLLELIPSDMVGDGNDPPVVGNGVQGVDGQPFWADGDGVVSDDDDPIIVGDTFDIILGPATVNDIRYNPKTSEPETVSDIDALLVTVTFDVSGAQTLLPITLSEGVDSATLGTSNFYLLDADLGFESGGGGMSFNPADDDLVGAFLLTDPTPGFNAGVDTDIGDYVLSAPGWTGDCDSLYRIDLWGVDRDYEYTSGSGGGEIVSSASNSSGGYLVPEPSSIVIIGGLALGALLKKRTLSRRT